MFIDVIDIGVGFPPTAVDDFLETDLDTDLIISTGIDLLGNDTDNGDGLEFDSFDTTATAGTVVDNLDGTLTYTPPTGFSGSDQFDYTITDTGGVSAETATVFIDVINIPITLEEATGHGWEGSNLFFNFRATAGTGQIVMYEVDVDSDGTFDVVVMDHDPMLDGIGIDEVPLLSLLGAPAEEGTYPAVVRISTDLGETAEFNFDIDIANTPPDVHLESTSTALPVAGVSHWWDIEVDEPGPDTITEITIDWGDGSSITLPGTTTIVSHVYLNDGEYAAEITVVDEDDTYIYGELTMTVGPVAGIQNPAPLYNLLMSKLASRVVKQTAHVITLRNVRVDWTTHQVAEGIIKLNSTGAAAFGLSLRVIQNWETNETSRMDKLGFDVTFDTKAFMKYYITGGIPAPGGGTYGEVNFGYHVYTKATVTNRATGAVTTTIKKIWYSGNNSGKDKTYSAAVNQNPSPETLPTTPAQFNAGYTGP